MNMREFENRIYDLRYLVGDKMDSIIDEKGIYFEYGVNTERKIEEAMMEYVETLIADKDVIDKIAKKALRAAVAEDKERVKEYKNYKRKNRELWKRSGGKIPCLCECGTIFVKTKEEVLEGNNNTICKNCCEGRPSGFANDVFSEKNVYKIFGIE